MPDTQPVPLLDLKAQYAPIREEIRAAMDRVADSQYFIGGPEVEGLEREVAAYSQCQFGIGVTSGTDALIVALMAIGIQPGDEVIVPPYTFFATGGSVHRLGAKSVYVDIDPFTYNIDPAQIEAAITPRTKAIMPVHLYGQMADMDPIMAIARRHNLIVIEDAAQAIGSECHGRRAGSIGHIGCFSFFPSKNLGGFGDGGMVTTNDPDLAKQIKLLRNHGAEPKYYHKVVGGNFRLDALQAAVLSVKLPHLDAWSRGRRANAEFYDKKFRQAGLIEKGFVETPKAVYMARGDANHHIYNQYTLRVKDRDGLQARLRSKEIGSEIYYPVPLHLQECFRSLDHKAGDFPESERAAGEVLALPIYPELTEEQKNFVVAEIAAFYGEK
jgi:dTDP-4-amino-4,6-dideoxygalactose transaminase